MSACERGARYASPIERGGSGAGGRGACGVIAVEEAVPISTLGEKTLGEGGTTETGVASWVVLIWSRGLPAPETVADGGDMPAAAEVAAPMSREALRFSACCFFQSARESLARGFSGSGAGTGVGSRSGSAGA